MRGIMVTPTIYIEVLYRLCDAIGDEDYFSGSICFQADKIECRLAGSWIIYRNRVSYPEGDAEEVSDLIPVWWEFHTTLDSVELLNNFQFDELRTYLSNCSTKNNKDMNKQTNGSATALVPNAEVFAGQLPDLTKAEASPLELNGEYWTPIEVGENRRMFFKDLRVEQAIDQRTGENIELLVAYFVEPLPDGRRRVVRQASRRLTAVFENFADTIVPGMAFEITYKGKMKNKSNQNMSDTWSIVPLNTAGR